MSVDFDRDKQRWRVRWRENGKQRSRRFVTEAEAMTFDEERSGLSTEPPPTPHARAPSAAGDAIYAYDTKAGRRYRFVYRQSDGTSSSRRGFLSRRAAAAARRKLTESIDRGEIAVCREDFESFWGRFVADKRPYLTPGSHLDVVTHGHKRLVPFFGSERLSSIDSESVRDWLAVMVELVEADEISPKTVNNARTYLSMAFTEAVRRGMLPRNPCDGVPALPVERAEVEFLRLSEIDDYLAACSQTYRPLAEFLIGTGTRVSEAIATCWADVDLDEGVVRIHRQRARHATATRATKGKRFRSVQMGPRLGETLRALRVSRLSGEIRDDGWVFLCPSPSRGRYAGRTTPVPPHRKTVHDWHEAALEDAGIRDMPLHSLRHTAAAAWLAAGHPLIFVQRQLGHRSITTTEEHYGHLEGSFVKGAAASTEAAIIAARRAEPPGALGTSRPSAPRKGATWGDGGRSVRSPASSRDRPR